MSLKGVIFYVSLMVTNKEKPAGITHNIVIQECNNITTRSCQITKKTER